MPCILEAKEFSPASLAEIASFDCGSARWERIMADWITNSVPNGVLHSISRYKTKVWLYYTPLGQLVGFGSLGVTKWEWPPEHGTRILMSHIPAMAIQLPFQGQPTDGEKFSHQLMADLLYKAIQLGNEFLTLLVHEDNTKAQALYKSFAFELYTDNPAGNYVRMYRRLR